MSAYEYDKAFIDNLRNIFDKSNIFITDSESSLDINSALNKDRLNLPLINLNRIGYSLLSYKPQYMIFNGNTVVIDKENETISDLQAIPIRINYQIDVYTNNRKENDMIMRELIFYYTLHPTLLVNIPYGLDIQHDFNILLEDDIEDNSDIVEHKNRGRLYRQTIQCYTDDAYLWKSNTRDIIKIKDIIVTPKRSEINDSNI